MTRLVHLLGAFSLLCAAILYYAGVDSIGSLSPQGCEMSRMTPSYVLQNHFDHEWTPLTRRYSLWLYREVGWEGNELHGSPVLFIPGNAGSSQQVRSIASSATRQFYAQPYQIAEEFRTRSLSPLDVFAVEFNEDLSAFHGSTLDAQTRYTSRAIDYILSLYPAGTSIIVMAHSMGGVVATSLLPHANVSAIITMSTPHIVPPARFDRRIDRIYSANLKTLTNDPTPMVSICGGATDLMVPSESCILPVEDSQFDPPYRHTVFTSALEGCWTGVDHLAMVWCHQVRWRVARAALELGTARNVVERGVVLDTWLRDGHTVPPLARHADESFTLQDDNHSAVSGGRLVYIGTAGTRVYTVPVPPSAEIGTPARFVLYVSQGTVAGVSPHRPAPLTASVFVCPDQHCKTLRPSVLKLIPNPAVGKTFPVPQVGAADSDGVVLFEADVMASTGHSVAVRIESSDNRGWVVGGFVSSEPVVSDASGMVPFIGLWVVKVPEGRLLNRVHFPNFLTNVLVIYSLVPRLSGRCSGLLAPLLQYTSQPVETHHYPLLSQSPILLHTHSSGPFISSEYTHGLNLTFHDSGEDGCFVSEVRIAVDWWSTVGRWGTRYAAPAASWAVGVVACILYDAWGSVERSNTVPSVASAMAGFVRERLPWMLLGSFVLSFVPLPASMWLGNRGEPLLAPLAPLMLAIATGMVSVSWWVVNALMWPLSYLHRSSTSQEPIPISRTSKLLSLALISILIFLIIPWQVAFLGCWLYHLYTCATPRNTPPPTTAITAVPLLSRRTPDELEEDEQHSPQPTATPTQDPNQLHARDHLLLLMTWLLPLAAPVLAVWVRTLYSAGITTPFDGDHNVLNVLPYLVLVDGAWGWNWVWRLDLGRVVVKGRWTMGVLAGAAFVVGPREGYLGFEVATVVLGVGVLARVGQPLVHPVGRT